MSTGMTILISGAVLLAAAIISTIMYIITGVRGKKRMKEYIQERYQG